MQKRNYLQMIKESGSNINEKPKIKIAKLPKLCYNNNITTDLKSIIQMM